MGGLRRLEYRGYDSAGVAVIDDDGAHRARAKRAGKLQVLADDLEAIARCTDGAHRHRPHPLGDARRPDRPQRAPAPRRRRQARPHPQRHHRELLRAEARAARRGLHLHERDRHRGRRRAARPRVPPRRRPHRGASAPPSSPPRRRLHPPRHARGPARRRRRRPPQLAARHRPRRRRELPRLGCRRLRRVHPARRGDRPGPDRHDHRRLGHRHRLRRRPRRGRGVRGRVGRLGRREGRLVELHGARRSPSSPRPSRTRSSVACVDGTRAHPRARVRSATRCSRGIDRIIVIACGTAAYAGMVAKYAIEQWAAHPGRGRALPRVPLPRPGARRRHARGLDQPVGRDHGHAHGGEVRPRARAPARSRSATRRARRSRASPTPSSTRTPAPRSPWRRRRRSSPRSPRSTSSACTSRACAARSPTARSRANARRAAGHPREARRRCSSQAERVGQLAHWMTDTRSVLFLGRHVGYPVALEGALKLKELAYIHAEGFAAGELKHGPIALIEPGQPVFVVVPSPRDSAIAAPEGRLEHPGDPRPRRPRHRDRRGGRRRGAAVRRRGHAASRSPRRCSSRCSRWCRCRSSRWSSRRPRASTSTSRATSRSPSRWSDDGAGGAVIVGIGVDVVDIARFERAIARTPALVERLFAESERGSPRCARSPRRFAAKEALIKALGGHDGHPLARHARRAGRARATPTSSSPAALAEHVRRRAASTACTSR